MSIVYYSQPNNDFSDLYIKVRKKEARFYSEEDIKKLPDLKSDHNHYLEWQSRKKSAIRFVEYLKSKNRPLKIVDVGCGNGWFSNLMSTVEKTEVIGLDVNLTELKQAANAFQKENLTFVYANLFEKTKLNTQKFDIIVFNSSIQYFENLVQLFQIVADLLSPNGEIHIMDSPFYENKELLKAKRRTDLYYKKLGFQEMAKHYFHHCYDDISGFKVLYKPKRFNLIRLAKDRDSPFRWVMMSYK